MVKTGTHPRTAASPPSLPSLPPPPHQGRGGPEDSSCWLTAGTPSRLHPVQKSSPPKSARTPAVPLNWVPVLWLLWFPRTLCWSLRWCAENMLQSLVMVPQDCSSRGWWRGSDGTLGPTREVMRQNAEKTPRPEVRSAAPQVQGRLLTPFESGSECVPKSDLLS